jgi:hypothetical protein
MMLGKVLECSYLASFCVCFTLVDHVVVRKVIVACSSFFLSACII